MPKYVTIECGDQDGYNMTAKPVRDATHKDDERFVSIGAVIGVVGQSVEVRNPEDSDVQVSEGPFLRLNMPIVGYDMIDAANM